MKLKRLLKDKERAGAEGCRFAAEKASGHAIIAVLKKQLKFLSSCQELFGDREGKSDDRRGG